MCTTVGRCGTQREMAGRERGGGLVVAQGRSRKVVEGGAPFMEAVCVVGKGGGLLMT